MRNVETSVKSTYSVGSTSTCLLYLRYFARSRADSYVIRLSSILFPLHSPQSHDVPLLTLVCLPSPSSLPLPTSQRSNGESRLALSRLSRSLSRSFPSARRRHLQNRPNIYTTLSYSIRPYSRRTSPRRRIVRLDGRLEQQLQGQREGCDANGAYADEPHTEWDTSGDGKE